MANIKSFIEIDLNSYLKSQILARPQNSTFFGPNLISQISNFDKY